MTNNNTTDTPWKVTLLTLFPDMFPGPLGHSLAGKALEKSLWNFETIDIRNFGLGKYQMVDDSSFGGGHGLVMRPDVLGPAIEQAKKSEPDAPVIYFSPRGKPLTQTRVEQLAATPSTIMVCGRFEGIDERIIEKYDIEELSIGDYVLSGGEIAAFVAIDACIRLLPGVLKNPCTLEEESFSTNGIYEGLLEYPLYTRPSTWDDRQVPEVLLSGNHQDIANWRLEQAKEITQARRKDLWETYKNKEKP